MQKKTVLVTGSSTGFGKATVEHFAAQGWNVVATMRNPADGAALTAVPDVLVTRLDVQDRASIDAAVAAGIARFGGIDALVNNAGFGLFGVFESTSREKILEQFEVNVFGLMDVTRALLPHFRARRNGVILNISSGAGVFTLPMISLYAASKHALEGFSEALAYELLPLGIVVKIIEPGGVVTTSFGQRSGTELGKASALADYDPFVEAMNGVFAGLRGERHATAEDVAKVIFDATTDGTERLRYVATDDIKPLLAAKHELSDEAYVDFMRAKFAFSRRAPSRG